MRPLIAGGAALLLVGMGGVLFWGGRSDTPTSHIAESSSVGRTLASIPQTSDPKTEDDGPLAYRFERKIEIETGDKKIVDLTLRGKLWALGLSSAHPSEMIVRIDEPASFSEAPVMRVRLDRYLRIASIDSAQNESVTTKHPKNEAAMMSRFAADLVDQYLFFENHDLQGDYQARIRKVSATKFKKVKLRYDAAPYSEGDIEQSNHVLESDGKRVARTITGNESFTLGQGPMPLRTTTRYRIERDAPTTTDSTAFSSLKWKPAPLPAVATEIVTDPSFALQDVPEFSALLAQLGSGPLKTASERLGLFRNLVKRLDAEPTSAANEAKKTLPDLFADPDRLKVMIGALAASRSEDAQALLRETYVDPRLPGGSRDAIVSAWITTDAPLPNETLQALAKQDTPGALLAIGAQVARTTDPRQKSTLEALLASRLRQAQTPGEKTTALDAIGNTGSASFAPQVRDYLPDPNEAVRARAFLALRRMPGEEIHRLILTGENDPSSEVRQSVRMALRLRNE